MKGRLGARLLGLVCTVGVLAVTVGVPWWLQSSFGWPFAIPDGGLWENLRRPLTNEMVERILVLFVWAMWGWYLLAPVVVEAGATVLGLEAPRVPLAGGSQSLAAELVAGALLLFAPLQAGNREGLASAPVPIAAVHPAVEAVAHPAAGEGQHAGQTAPTDVHPVGEWYTVAPRDNPWKLSARVYGRGELVTNLWNANAFRPMRSGRVYSRPGLIRPGDVLFFPTPETIRQYGSMDAPVARAARALIFAGDVLVEPPVPPDVATQAPQPSVAIGIPEGEELCPEPSPPVDRGDGPSTPVTATTDASEPPTPVNTTDESTAPDDGAGDHVKLPSGSWVPLWFATGFLAHMAFQRLLRRRQYRPKTPRPGVAPRPRPVEEPLGTLAGAGRRAPSRAGATATKGGAWNRPGADVGTVHDLDPMAEGALRLCGDGAADAARAIVVGAFLRNPPPATAAIWFDRDVSDELVGDIGGLSPGWREAQLLDELEVERARRARLFAHVEASDLETYRRSDEADEPVDDLLVVARPSEPQAGRWRALADAGPRLGIGMLCVDGADIGGATVRVDSAGDVEDDSGGGGSPSLLTFADARSLLETIVSARSEVVAQNEHREEAEDAFPFAAVEATEDRPPAPGAAARATVRVFGRVGLFVDGREVGRPSRESATESLAFLTYYPDGDRREAIIDALWEDHDAERGYEAFRNAVKSLRAWVREALGRRDVDVVVASGGGGRYRLQSDLFEVDLWEFQRALKDAVEAETPSERADKRRQALALYTGDFAPEVSSLWAETARHRLREKAVDTAVSIAEHEEQTGDPEAALAVVQTAIDIDPLVEDVYARGVRLLVGLGRLDSARQLYRSLQRRLDAELGVDPSPATRDYVGKLLSDAERRRAALDDRGTSPASEAASAG